MSIDVNPRLKYLMQLAYSAERAASFVYQGHANSVSDPKERLEIQQIEADEWEHRKILLEMMGKYDIQISKYLEIRGSHLWRSEGQIRGSHL